MRSPTSTTSSSIHLNNSGITGNQFNRRKSVKISRRLVLSFLSSLRVPRNNSERINSIVVSTTRLILGTWVLHLNQKNFSKNSKPCTRLRFSQARKKESSKNRDVEVSDFDCSGESAQRSLFFPVTSGILSFNVLFSPRWEPPADAILRSNLYLIKQVSGPGVSVSPSWPAEDRSSPAFGLRVGVH